MKTDEFDNNIKVCGGNYDSAMHYDCAECKAPCPFRKEAKPAIWAGIVIVILAIAGLALIFF
ncbi:MAG: hypothetical protein IPJ03_15905 [Ignavibacteriales bacterium]|nr:hypothetical protein [Ignavibacteriales bacterium]